jgi:hypothetical protein
VEKPEEYRPLGRPRHRWEDNITKDFSEILWKSVDCIQLVEDGIIGPL